ncbi:UNVERIFIED_CONTAM: hypothetical protein RMT77_003918 [Armadillidium vulgare]
MRKKSSITLASSLGIDESSGAEFSLYSQLNESASTRSSTNTSSEDLSCKTGDQQRECVTGDSKLMITNGDNFYTRDGISLESSGVDPLVNSQFKTSQSPPNTETLPGLNDAQIAVECSFNYLSRARDEPISTQAAAHAKEDHKEMKPSFISYLSAKASPKKDKSKKKKSGGGYLQKAEQLLSKISLRESKLSHNDVKNQMPTEPCLKSSVCDLGNYRVIGSSDHIIIAVDLTTQETVAIKVVEKNSSTDENPPRFQPSVSFMVPLLRYYETDFAYYLILKYISGGKVWNHLKKFIKQPSSNGSHRCHTQTSNISNEEEKFLTDGILERFPERVADDPPTNAESGCVVKRCRDNKFSECKDSEEDIKSLSFQHNLAVVECVSSVDHYTNPCYIPDRVHHHQSSLSNIIDFHQRGLGDFSNKDRTVKVLPHSKCKSLENLKSASSYSGKHEKLNGEPKAPLQDAQSEGFQLARDSVSIGSDTLSGVSENFSCSSNIPDIDIELNGERESKLSSSSNSLKQAENLTPPSMDVSSLIENSKKLIADVNRTLEKSKQQIIRTFSASKGGPGPLEEAKEAKEVLNEYISKNVTNNISKSNEKCCVDVNEKTDRASNNGTDVLSFKSAEHVSIERSEAISNEETDWTSVYLSAQSNSFPVPEPVTDIPNLPVDDYKLQEKQLMDMASSIDICSGSKVRMSTSTKSFDCGDTFKSQVYVNEDASSVLLQNESFSFGSSTCSHIVEGNDHVPEGLVRVWVSQVIMALDSLHKRDIIWRDFNPSNLLLDEGGSILLTYKYLWSTNDYWYIKSQGFPEDENDCWMLSLGYIAPELFNPVCKATEASDWWSVGALLFHLLTGKDVASCFPCGFTSHTQINFPSTISEEAESLISSLLCADPMERLGSSNGVKVIKEHPFFIGIEWPQ